MTACRYNQFAQFVEDSNNLLALARRVTQLAKEAGTADAKRQEEIVAELDTIRRSL